MNQGTIAQIQNDLYDALRSVEVGDFGGTTNVLLAAAPIAHGIAVLLETIRRGAEEDRRGRSPSP